MTLIRSVDARASDSCALTVNLNGLSTVDTFLVAVA